MWNLLETGTVAEATGLAIRKLVRRWEIFRPAKKVWPGPCYEASIVSAGNSANGDQDGKGHHNALSPGPAEMWSCCRAAERFI